MDDRIQELEDKLAQARAEVRASFENRALIYAHIFDVLAEELGSERATELMTRAIRRRGVEVGAKYRAAARVGDLEEVARIFVEGSPCEGALFEPAVEEPAQAGRIVLRMTSCPLVDAWRAAGYPDERVDLLCEIAAAVDHGTFEGAGLELRFLDRQPCGPASRCLLELRIPGSVS